MTPWSDVVVPLAAVLVGAAITYWLNVRTRRATRAEDAYHDAIAAIAEAQAARNYISAATWDGAAPEELAAFEVRANREAVESGIRAIGHARVALARATAYDPQLQPYLDVLAHRFIEDAAAPAVERLRQDLGQG